MKTYVLILIIIGALILFGPIMLFFAWLNKVDPFVLDKVDPKNVTPEQEKSIAIIAALRPLFVPLWLEKKLIDWILEKTPESIKVLALLFILLATSSVVVLAITLKLPVVLLFAFILVTILFWAVIIVGTIGSRRS